MSINLLLNEEIRKSILANEVVRLNQIEEKTAVLQSAENGGLLLGSEDPTKAILEFPNLCNVSTTEYVGAANDNLKLIGKNSSAWELSEDGLRAYVKPDPIIIPPVEPETEPTTIYTNLFESIPKVDIGKTTTTMANTNLALQADDTLTLSAVNTLDVDAKTVDITGDVALTGSLEATAEVKALTMYTGEMKADAVITDDISGADLALSATGSLSLTSADDLKIAADVVAVGDWNITGTMTATAVQCNDISGGNVDIAATGTLSLSTAGTIDIDAKDIDITGAVAVNSTLTASAVVSGDLSHPTKLTITAPETEFKNAVKFTEDIVIPAGKFLTNTANTEPFLSFKNGSGQYKHFISTSTRQQADTGSAWLHMGTYDSTLNTGAQRSLLSMSDNTILMHTQNGAFNNAVVNPSLKINNTGAVFEQPVNFNTPSVNFNYNLTMPNGKYITNNWDNPFIVLPNASGNPKYFISSGTRQFTGTSENQSLNIGTYDSSLASTGTNTLIQMATGFIKMYARQVGGPDASTVAPFELRPVGLSLGTTGQPCFINTGVFTGPVYRAFNSSTYMNNYSRNTPHGANFITNVAVQSDESKAPVIQMKTKSSNAATSTALDPDNFILKFADTLYNPSEAVNIYVKLAGYWDSDAGPKGSNTVSYPIIRLLPDPGTHAFNGYRIFTEIEAVIYGTTPPSQDAILKVMWKMSDAYPAGIVWGVMINVFGQPYWTSS